DLPANSTFYIGVADFIAEGGSRIFGYLNTTALGDYRATGSTTRSGFLTSGNPSALGPSSTYGPIAIVGKGWAAAGRPPVPLVVGDSIGFGGNDNFNVSNGRGVRGYINRGLDDGEASDRVAYGNFCCPGEALANVVGTDGDWAKRRAVLAEVGFPFTSILGN